MKTDCYACQAEMCHEKGIEFVPLPVAVDPICPGHQLAERLKQVFVIMRAALEKYANQPQRYGHEAAGSGLGPEVAIKALAEVKEIKR